MEEALKQTQELKLQQRLTPMQVQFVRMLEMTGPEVEDEVRRAVDENPALEIADSDISHPNDFDDDSFNESAEDMRLADYPNEDETPSYRLEAHNHSADDEYFEPIAVASDGNLIDNLSKQLSEYELSKRQLIIADHIIGNIDDNGYLTRTENAIADDLAFKIGIEADITEVRQVLEIVRSLDPPGVGAIDLRDCLLLQLRRRESSVAVKTAIEIIAHYFDLFSKKHYDKLASALGISEENLRDAIGIICSLNPKPGGQLGEDIADERARHIIPDFSVDVDGDSITLTLLNNIPELQIEESFNREWRELSVHSRNSDREALAFIKQKHDEAASFIKVLKMRQETLFRVMKAIIHLQHDFFISDDESRLRPMILKDIAAITGYDLSVISRATAGKYVTTPNGIYPLKLFFNERPKDDDTSSHEILASLKEIIASEDHLHPLSDEQITSLLVARGYDIARRTVAKYREKLGFPVARLRKKL